MKITAQQISSHRLVIVTGHFGTGKTEFCVNYALDLAAGGEKLLMADLDIVNPYFRSRERREELKAAGVRLITSSQECSDADVPALPAEVLTIFEDRSCRGLLDIGGDPDGARVLARFRPKIAAEDYQMVFVSNANRPEVATAEDSISYLRAIEEVTGLSCGGIVNNTHLCGETTAADILSGAALAEEISRKTGIPVLCHVAEERLVGQLGSFEGPGAVTRPGSPGKEEPFHDSKSDV